MPSCSLLPRAGITLSNTGGLEASPTRQSLGSCRGHQSNYRGITVLVSN